jgi:hypothetical protein
MRIFDSKEGYLHLTATAFTLAIFFAINLVQRVEANWSGFYLISLAPWLATLSFRNPRHLQLCFALNLAIMLTLAIYASAIGHGAFPNAPQSRITKEVHGFQDLAVRLSKLQGPIFADTYQVVSMVSLSAPHIKIQQMPKITRHSELTRNPKLRLFDSESLQQAGGFWLLLSDDVPPIFSGFKLESLEKVYDCADGQLQTLSREDAALGYTKKCTTFHEWLLARYNKDNTY